MSTSRVFDVAGPKQQRRVRIITVISTLVILVLALLAVEKLHYEAQLVGERWRVFFDANFIRFLLDGFLITLKVCAVSVFTSAGFGILLALGRLAPVFWLRVPATTSQRGPIR